MFLIVATTEGKVVEVLSYTTRQLANEAFQALYNKYWPEYCKGKKASLAMYEPAIDYVHPCYLDGRIENIRISDRAKSEEEIRLQWIDESDIQANSHVTTYNLGKSFADEVERRQPELKAHYTEFLKRKREERYKEIEAIITVPEGFDGVDDWISHVPPTCYYCNSQNMEALHWYQCNDCGKSSRIPLDEIFVTPRGRGEQ